MAKSSSRSSMFDGLHEKIVNLNQSKIFAGLMIIVLNIASKFVTFRFGKSTEMYLKYTFSRQILVFAMAWMGTRDIYIAAALTLVFIVFFDFLFNENSSLCVLPNEFKEYYKILTKIYRTKIILRQRRRLKSMLNNAMKRVHVIKIVLANKERSFSLFGASKIL